MKVNIRKQDEIVIFDIEGDISRIEITDVTLHQLVKEQLDLGNTKILLNLGKVGFIDSFGVGEIVSSLSQ
jgi:anti-anti-sigma factor